MSTLDFDRFRKLFASGREIKVEKYEEKEADYFSVSGFPHYENVVSNILAFFFDYQREHHFKDLWLKCLLDCYNEKERTNYGYSTDREIKVSREENTDKGRIDIFIECETLLIVIENKIYSGVGNPLDSYHRFAGERQKKAKNKSIVEILLTLNKENDHQKDGYNFVNITYQELFEKIEQSATSYLDAKNKWVVFMDEFICNIRNLQEKKEMDVNSEWQKFLKVNSEGVSAFLENFLSDLEKKKSIFKAREEGIRNKLSQKHIEMPVMGTFGTQGHSYFSIYMNFQTEEYHLALEVYSILKPYSNRAFDKYYIDIWNRDTAARKNWEHSEVFLQIKKELEKEYSCELVNDFGWGNALLVDACHTNWSSFDKEEFEDRMVHIYEIVYRILNAK